MPITAELENVRKFESVGFTHEQAEVLTESLEKAVTSGHESLKDFIRQQNKELRNELSIDIASVRNEIKDLEVHMLESQRDLMIKFITIVTAIVGIATAIIKLF